MNVFIYIEFSFLGYTVYKSLVLDHQIIKVDCINFQTKFSNKIN